MNDVSRTAIITAGTNPAAPPAKLAYSISEAAKISGISRSMLYLYVARGVLPIRKAGSRSLVLADDLKKFVHRLPRLSPGKPEATA
jgi:excisionase family DNA binding protein